MLQVSDLTPGALECDIEVTIAYNDGPKASKLFKNPAIYLTNSPLILQIKVLTINQMVQYSY